TARFMRGLRLFGVGYPAPLLLDRTDSSCGVQTELSEKFAAPSPANSHNMAFVARDREFWKIYCSGRVFNGAVPLRMATNEGEANIVVRLLEVGRFRYASLMALHLEPPSVLNVKRAGA